MKHFCREASRLMSDGYERSLTPVERFRLRLHAWMCTSCRNYRFNLGILDRLFDGMRRHADEHAPCLSEKDRERILSNIRQQTQHDI